MLAGSLWGQEISPIHYTGTGTLYRTCTVEGGGVASEQVPLEGDFYTISYGNALRGLKVVSINPSYGPLIGHDDGELDGDPPYPPPTPVYPKYDPPWDTTNTIWGSGPYLGVEYIGIQDGVGEWGNEIGMVAASWEDFDTTVMVTGTLKTAELSLRRLEVTTNEYEHVWTEESGGEVIQHTQTWTYVSSDEYVFEKLTPFGLGMDALLLDCEGDVEVLFNLDDGDSEWENAEPGTPLGTNMMISTGYRSTARISLPGGRIVTIKEMTQLRIDVFFHEEKATEVELLLRIGSVNAVVKQSSDKKVISETSFKVRTPTPTISVRGTQFSINVNSNGAGILHMVEGVVDGLTTNAAGGTVTQTVYAGDRVVFSSNSIDSVTDTRQSRSVVFDFGWDERARWRLDDDRWALTDGRLQFEGQGRGGRSRALLAREFLGVDMDFNCAASVTTNWGLQFGIQESATNRFELTIDAVGNWRLEGWTNGVMELLRQGTDAGLGSSSSNRLSIDRCEASFSCNGSELFHITHATPIEGKIGFFADDAAGSAVELDTLNLTIHYVDSDDDGLEDVLEGELIGDPELPVFSLEDVDDDTDLDGDGYGLALEQECWTDPTDLQSHPGTCCGTVQLQRVWTRLHGNSSFNRFYDAHLLDSNRIWVAGYSWGPMDGAAGTQADAMVAELDGDGQLQSSFLFGDAAGADYLYGVSLMSDGRLAVCGETGGGFDGWTNAGSNDAFVAVLSTNGILEWSRWIGSAGDDQLRDLVVMGNGDIAVVGRIYGDLPSHEIAGTSDGVVAMYSPEGALRWMNFWSSTNSDNVAAVLEDLNGELILGGFAGGELDGQVPMGTVDVCCRRMTTNGWADQPRLAGTAGNEYAFNGAADLDRRGDVLLGSRTHGDVWADAGRGNGDAMLTRFPTSGESAQSWTWGTTNRDEVSAVHVMANGLIAVATVSNGDWPDHAGAGDYDAALHVFDCNGHLVAQDFLGTTGYDYPYALVSTGNRLMMLGHTSGDLNGEVNNGERDGFIVSWEVQMDAPVPADVPPFHIQDIQSDSEGLQLEWPLQIGTSHRVEWSTNPATGYQMVTSGIRRSCILTNVPPHLDQKGFFRVFRYR